MSITLQAKIVYEAFITFLRRFERTPTAEELAKFINQPVDKVRRHLRSLRFDPVEHPLRILTPEIVLSIAETAKKGSVPAQKLWLQLMEGYSEEHGLKTQSSEMEKIDHIIDEINNAPQAIEVVTRKELDLMNKFIVSPNVEIVEESLHVVDDTEDVFDLRK